jgi:hypothetical protein
VKTQKLIVEKIKQNFNNNSRNLIYILGAPEKYLRTIMAKKSQNLRKK